VPNRHYLGSCGGVHGHLEITHGLYYACENEENAFLNMISQIQEDDWSDGMTLEEFKSDLDGYLGNK